MLGFGVGKIVPLDNWGGPLANPLPDLRVDGVEGRAVVDDIVETLVNTSEWTDKKNAIWKELQLDKKMMDRIRKLIIGQETEEDLKKDGFRHLKCPSWILVEGD